MRVNRAIALRYVAGADHALREVDAVSEDLDRYHLLHATRAEFLRERPRRRSARRGPPRAGAHRQPGRAGAIGGADREVSATTT